jgi:hypothetical protein
MLLELTWLFLFVGFMARTPDPLSPGRNDIWLNQALRDRDEALAEVKRLKRELASYKEFILSLKNVFKLTELIKSQLGEEAIKDEAVSEFVKECIEGK